jgi:hypothetical protein
MSYSSDLTVVDCDARMKAIDVGKARRLLAKEGTRPESCFLDEMREASDAAIDEGQEGAMIDIPKDRCWFSGCVSPSCLATIAPLIVGRLSGFFVGEDGETHGGFAIENGKLEKRTITVTLT